MVTRIAADGTRPSGCPVIDVSPGLQPHFSWPDSCQTSMVAVLSGYQPSHVAVIYRSPTYQSRPSQVTPRHENHPGGLQARPSMPTKDISTTNPGKGPG